MSRVTRCLIATKEINSNCLARHRKPDPQNLGRRADRALAAPQTMLGRGALAPLSFHSKPTTSDGRSLMNHQSDLRAFLSRQKAIPYCLECLQSHGGLSVGGGDAIQLALHAVRSYPTALTAVIELCSTCGMPKLCLVFPGRIIGPEENCWIVKLLMLQLLPTAA